MPKDAYESSNWSCPQPINAYSCLYAVIAPVIDHEKTQLNIGKSHRKYRQTATELTELKEGWMKVFHIYMKYFA